MSDWLKASAPLNIVLILVTEDTFHPPISWLKEVAPANIPLIEVTLPVFQLPMSPLKAMALENMEVMSVTDVLEHKSRAALQKLGLIRTEGREYVVQEGDICQILFNV